MRQITLQLQLARLTLDQFGVGGGENPDRLLAEVGGCHLRRPRHEEVAGEDRNGVVPVGVDRTRSASRVGLVDDIVVVEGSHVDQLNGYTCLYGPVVLRRTELGCQQREQRAESLAAGEEQMLGDLGQIGVVGGGRIDQSFLDDFELFPDSGNMYETLEVFHR